MRAHSSTMKSLDRWLGHKIFLGQRETAFPRASLFENRRRTNRPRYPTPHPQQPHQVHPTRRGRFRAQRIRHIHPRTNLFRSRQPRNQGERQRGASGPFGADHLGQRTHRQAALQHRIHRLNAGRHNLPGDSGRRCQRSRNSLGEGSFDLGAQCEGGRGHNLRLIFA